MLAKSSTGTLKTSFTKKQRTNKTKKVRQGALLPFLLLDLKLYLSLCDVLQSPTWKELDKTFTTTVDQLPVEVWIESSQSTLVSRYVLSSFISFSRPGTMSTEDPSRFVEAVEGPSCPVRNMPVLPSGLYGQRLGGTCPSGVPKVAEL